MNHKEYNGYKSFQYLEPGEDYTAFPLAKEIDRVPSHPISVTAEQQQRLEQIFAEHTIVSLHEHTFVTPEDVNRIFEYRREGRDVTGYEGLSRSGLDIVFENFMDGTAMITSKAGWKWNDVIHDLGMRYSDIAHQDMLYRAETYQDLLQAKPTGRIAMVSSLEAATAIENEIDRLDILYGFGVRICGIAYSEANALGCGLKEKRDGGLTDFGRKCVKRMNKLGMAIEVSHSGDQTSLDTIEISDQPIFITHAGARALWNTNRLKPDHIIKACAERGGVLGIEAAPHTTLTQKNPSHSIESFMEHFEYVANLVGIDHVAFGPDTLYGDHVGLHHAFAAALSIKAAHAGNVFEEVEYVKGIENPTEAFPNIVRWMITHGYSDTEIAKAVGGNILRVLKQVWAR